MPRDGCGCLSSSLTMLPCKCHQEHQRRERSVGMPRDSCGCLSSSLHLGARPNFHSRLLSGKTLRSVLAVPPSLNLWRSRLLAGRCAPVLACVLARLRRLDVKTAAAISILVHLVTLLMWHSAAAVKRAVTFQGGWAAKPGPGESKVAVHRAGADVKGPRIVISGFCT